MLDLTQFVESKTKICVRCYDEQSTLAFLEEMKKQYPEKCTFWSGDENHWGEYNTGHVDYFPCLNGIGVDGLCWDAEDWAEDNGYTIVDYYDIPDSNRVTDFGDIAVSEFALDTLFN